ncbi:hypothetical protein [Shinella sp.]|uniref:hypothetical protein n=1 Tax=Shinella sp. TaxID=1870904 RepID=UPI0028981CE9|nr:hypothetical protein [Shinella sp.]
MTQSARRIASVIADDDGDFTILQQSIRKFRAIPASKFRAANDNDPRKTIRMTPYNGGCSTLSGMVPVSVARVSMLTKQVAA